MPNGVGQCNPRLSIERFVSLKVANDLKKRKEEKYTGDTRRLVHLPPASYESYSSCRRYCPTIPCRRCGIVRKTRQRSTPLAMSTGSERCRREWGLVLRVAPRTCNARPRGWPNSHCWPSPRPPYRRPSSWPSLCPLSTAETRVRLRSPGWRYPGQVCGGRQDNRSLAAERSPAKAA